MNATIAISGDWQAVYVDGRKVEEGHSVHPRDLLFALGYKVDQIEVQEDEFGGAEFPELLDNIQEATE